MELIEVISNKIYPVKVDNKFFESIFAQNGNAQIEEVPDGYTSLDITDQSEQGNIWKHLLISLSHILECQTWLQT